MNQKTKLIKLAEGCWVNPGFITAVEDNRDDRNFGNLIVATAGYSIVITCMGHNDRSVEKADAALATLGLTSREN